MRTEIINLQTLREHFCDALTLSLLPPSGKIAINSPVRPLLVQHAVSALLAADGVAALQRDLVVAVAAQVVHRALGVFEAAAAGLEAGVGGAGGAEVGLAAGGGGLVLFAGHDCVCCGCVMCVVDVVLLEWNGLVVWFGWLVMCRKAGGGTSSKSQAFKPRSLRKARERSPVVCSSGKERLRLGSHDRRRCRAVAREDRMPILADQTR